MEATFKIDSRPAETIKISLEQEDFTDTTRYLQKLKDFQHALNDHLTQVLTATGDTAATTDEADMDVEEGDYDDTQEAVANNSTRR